MKLEGYVAAKDGTVSFQLIAETPAESGELVKLGLNANHHSRECVEVWASGSGVTAIVQLQCLDRRSGQGLTRIRHIPIGG